MKIGPNSTEVVEAAHDLDEKSPHPQWKGKALANVGYAEYQLWLFTPDGQCFFEETWPAFGPPPVRETKKPPETKPADTKPVETKPTADTKPAANPALKIAGGERFAVVDGLPEAKSRSGHQGQVVPDSEKVSRHRGGEVMRGRCSRI